MSRHVLVLAEHRDGALEPLTRGLAARARALVAPSGGTVSALLPCGDPRIAEQLADADLDRVHVVAHSSLAIYSPEAFSRTATEVVRRLAPDLFLCGHTFEGMEVAPWVAAALRAPLLPNCVGLEVDGDELFADRLVHGQAWQARLALRWQGTVVASLARSAGSADAESRGGRPCLEPFDLDPAALPIRTAVRGTTRPATADVDIARAEVVVGVGRGIRERSNLELIDSLAEALGGVVGCSRPLVDLDWLPYRRQVGASGKAIRPRVYLACGISGAAQHLAGIADAQTVIAINRDPDAPIFRVAHHGAVADLIELVPALTAEARRRRGVSP